MSDDEQGEILGEPAGSPEPQTVLSELAAVRRRTRSARRAYWFPLVLFGLLICAAAPLYDRASPLPRGFAVFTSTAATPTILGGLGLNSSPYLGWYWLFALIGGYLLTVFWYRWHGRRAGVQTAARGYLVTGIVLTVAALLIPLLSPLLPRLGWLWLGPADLWVRGTFAFLIIAAGLWVLAWAERSLALVITAAAYTGAVLLVSLYNIGNIGNIAAVNVTVLPAAVLLIAGAAAGRAAFVARRRVQPA